MLIACILSLVATSKSGRAQAKPDTATVAKPAAPMDSTKSAARTDSTKSGGIGVLVAPFIQYAPETSFVCGLAWFLRFRLSGDSGRYAMRPSSISGSGSYTEKHQISSGIYFDFYFPGDLYHWSGGIDFKRFPFDFYGVGDHTPVHPTDTYTLLWRGFHSEFTRNLNSIVSSLWDSGAAIPGSGLSMGIGIQLRSDAILSSTQNGPIQGGGIPGATGGFTSGAGLVINFDTRDNIYSPYTGEYIAITAYDFGKIFGSDFTNTRFTLDMRKYFPLFGEASPLKHILAVQGLVTIVNGFEPFYAMAQLGGDQTMRGYYLGQFRDNDMVVLQTEYRFPVYWRFGLVAFGDLGEVSGRLHDLSLSGIRYTFGAGLRVSIEEDERVGVRLDYGVGDHSQGLYFSYLEAF
jgi:outer membrane protein assembly factor BamA